MGVYIVDRDGVLQHYNRRAAQMWRCAPRPGEDNLFTMFRLLRPDGTALPQEERPVVRVLATGETIREVEVILQRPDGSRLQVTGNMGPLLDEAGNVVGCVNCFQDITERKADEAAVRDSEQRFRATFDQAAVGFAQTDLDGRWLRINDRLCEILGRRREDMLGRSFADVTHPDDIDRNLGLFQDLLADRIKTYALEKRYIRGDGSIVWANVTVSLVRNEDGTPNYLIAVVEDITSRKQQEAELREAKRAAEAANAAKDQFLAALSHELRTPLTPILMSTSALENDAALPAEVREELSMVRRNVELEARLIDDLLDLTRVSRGKLELNCEPVDAHALLREAVQTCCGSDINNKRLDMDVDLSAPRSTVSADAGRLQQVFWNLIKNAVKFTPSGGRISVSTANGAEDELVIKIEDNGIGIDGDVLPRIFDAFEQGGRDVTRHFGGLGLGLAISKALVELHNGRLAAVSAGLGKGATFTIVLKTTGAVERSLVGDGDVTTPRVGLRILLVEDHETTARVLGRLLRENDYQVQTANTLTDARDMARNNEFDLLISDLGLPDGSGLDLMRELAAQSHLKGIALSGYGMDEDIRRSRDVGFATHLTKPVDFRKLQAAISQVIGR